MNTPLKRLVMRKKCLSLARMALKGPLLLTEPLDGVELADVNYYTFTLLDGLSGAMKLSATVTDIVLPTLWNYLDAACSIVVGLNDLLDEDHHRQWQMRIQGALNIFGGVQMLILSLNPPLMAAMGVAGMPALMGNPAFVLSCGIDVIVSGIEFHYALKETSIAGWMEERLDEYDFVQQRIDTLEQENRLLETDAQYATLFQENEEGIQVLQERSDELLQALRIRYKVHAAALEDEALKTRLYALLGNLEALAREPLTPEEEGLERDIVKALSKAYNASLDDLALKSLTFVGMTMMAAATLSLVTTCPPAVPLLGFAITAVIASVYLYRHQKEIIQAAQSAFRFFTHPSHKKAEMATCEDYLLNARDTQLSDAPDKSGSYPLQ